MSPSQAVLDQKKIIIDEIKSSVDKSSAVFFVDYRGLSVSQLTELRGALRDSESTCSVIKNTFLTIAIKELDLKVKDGAFFGPTAMISSSGDVAMAAKSLMSFVKKNSELVSVKSGLLDREPIDEAMVKQLASLPSQDELRAKVVGAFVAPINQFVLNLSSPIRGLVYVLNAIKDKKQEVN